MRLRAWYRRHQTAFDVVIAAIFVFLDTWATLAGATWWPAHPDSLAWALLILQAATVGTLVFRRRAPVLVVGIMAAFTLAVTLLIWPAGAIHPANPDTIWAPYGTILAAYGPFIYRRERRIALISVGILALIVARPWQPSVFVITVGLGRTAGGPLLALYFETRSRLLHALRERAERAEREQYLLAEQARDEERARLAGEMHDVVTHRISLMVLQAGALRMTASDEPTRQAAEELRASGCQALEELRDLVGVLRAPPGADPVPSVEGFAALIDESVRVGTPTELIEEGDRALASPVVGRTAYRVLREALTNARKHAPGAHVTVRVSYAESGVRLDIRNDAPPGPGRGELAGTGSGLGLSNLRQRIELVHGTLEAGPDGSGGFLVRAELPGYVPTAPAAGQVV